MARIVIGVLFLLAWQSDIFPFVAQAGHAPLLLRRRFRNASLNLTDNEHCHAQIYWREFKQKSASIPSSDLQKPYTNTRFRARCTVGAGFSRRVPRSGILPEEWYLRRPRPAKAGAYS
jgi:hypothetical protein